MNSKDEISEIPGNFSRPKSESGGEFFPAALSLELAIQVAPLIFAQGGCTDKKIVQIARTFRSFLEEKEG